MDKIQIRHKEFQISFLPRIKSFQWIIADFGGKTTLTLRSTE